MKSSYVALNVKFKRKGCTDITSPNYDSKATIDDGSCIEKVFFDCIKDKLLNTTLGNCKSEEANKALEMYSYYQSLVSSIEEKNNVKINRYKDKLTDLCNCETC